MATPLIKNTWYTLEIIPNFGVTYPTLSTNAIIEMRTISALTNFAVYDINYAFDFLYLSD